jgi:serine/threonine protein phosphatase PrpC
MNEEFRNRQLHSELSSGEPAEFAPPSSAATDNLSNIPQEPIRQSSASFDGPTSKGTTPTPARIVPSSTRFRVEASALSDVGCVRANNEDFFGCDESLGIFVVCDGMGGMASGEVASSRAVSALMNSFADSASSNIPVDTRLKNAISAANMDVWENGQVPANKGMGTTAVVAALEDDKLIIGNVGDSRAYCVEDSKCTQVTLDHSLINELIRNGTLTPDSAHEADIPGMRSRIIRAVGIAPDVQPDFFSVDLRPNIAVLLTTDGLTRHVLQGEIGSIVASSPFESACADLIKLAKQRGGSDNITCVLLRALSI